MKQDRVHIDFETRSVVDLGARGVDVYSKHPTTDILCLAWRVNKGPVKYIVYGDPFPKELAMHLKKGSTFVAHNATFEFYIWNFCCVKKYRWPVLPLKQMDCTMLRCYAMGLPGHLGNAALALGLKMQKDLVGQRVMLQLCKPRSGPDEKCGYCKGTGVHRVRNYRTRTYQERTCQCVIWWEKSEFPEKYETTYTYCKQDVFVEYEVDERTLPLSSSEKQLWFLDQKINYRGLNVDEPTIKKCIDILAIESERLDEKMRKATKNQVATCRANTSLKDWINTFDIYKGAVYSKDGPPSKLKGEEGQPKWRKGDKKVCQGVGKDKVDLMLKMKDLPKPVRKALEIKMIGSKASTAKLKAMILGRSADGRVKGCFQFLGAFSTGRWAGRRIQFQNMPRPTIKQKQIEEIVDHISKNNDITKIRDWIEVFHGPPMVRIADCIRAMILAPKGKKFISVDFSSIESRVLAWLAGEEKKLNIYRSHGLVYEVNACEIFGLASINDVTTDQRLIGKVAELACGYQGGVKAFQSMAKNYLVYVPDKKAEQIKTAWRKANPNIVKYWYELEEASIKATENPGIKVSAGPMGRNVTFLKKGSFLFCRLPSGRTICYPYPKMRTVTTPWGEKKWALTYKGEEKKQFIIKVGYGGLLAENITQAVARDLLAESLLRVEDKNYPVVMHVHDELTVEVEKSFGSQEEIEKLMTVVPKWARDLPIGAEGWTGERYRK